MQKLQQIFKNFKSVVVALSLALVFCVSGALAICFLLKEDPAVVVSHAEDDEETEEIESLNWIHHVQAPSGTGTQEAPYLIASAENLAWVSLNVNDHSEGTIKDTYKYYKQTADIDLSSNIWIPIGFDENHPFNGYYDGQDFSITGMNFLSDSLSKFVASYGGTSFFIRTGYSIGEINGRELNTTRIVGFLESVFGEGNSFGEIKEDNLLWGGAGCFSPYIGLFGYVQNGTIKNVNLSGEFYSIMLYSSSIKVTQTYTGGITAYGGTIKYCNCDVVVKSIFLNPDESDGSGSSDSFVGGINGCGATVLNSTNLGDVSGVIWTGRYSSSIYVGGIIGGSGVVKNCFNKGYVTCGNQDDGIACVGGLVGYNGEISNSYNLDGYVIYDFYLGCRPGMNNDLEITLKNSIQQKARRGTTDFYLGGLVGFQNIGTKRIKDCFTRGEIRIENRWDPYGWYGTSGDYYDFDFSGFGCYGELLGFCGVSSIMQNCYSYSGIYPTVGRYYSVFITSCGSISNIDKLRDSDLYYSKDRWLGIYSFNKAYGSTSKGDAYWSADWDFSVSGWYIDENQNSGWPVPRQKDITSGTLEFDEDSFEYSGERQRPVVTFTFGGTPYVFDENTYYLDGLGIHFSRYDGAEGIVNAGTIAVTIYSSGQNSFAGKVTKTYEITKRSITLQADGKSMTYGDNAPTYTYQEKVNGEYVGEYVNGTIVLSKVLDGDSISPVSYMVYRTKANGKLENITSTVSSQNVGTYTIRIASTGLNANNYDITLEDGTLTVSKRSITIKAADKSITYGDSLDRYGYSITSGSLASNDVISAFYTVKDAQENDVTNSISSQNVGSTYKIYFNGVSVNKNGDDVTNNYDITTGTGTLTISKRSITLTISNLSAAYGDKSLDNPSFSCYVQSGSWASGNSIIVSYQVVENGDDITTSLKSQNVGSYTISFKSVEVKRYGVDVKNNYNITLNSGTLTISKRKVYVRIHLGDQLNKTKQTITYGDHLSNVGYVKAFSSGYDSNNDITLQGTPRYYIRLRTSSSGVNTTDILYDRDNTILKYNSYGYYVCVDGLSLSDADSKNFELCIPSSASGSSIVSYSDKAAQITVKKKPLTISANGTMTYGDSVPYFDDIKTITGLVDGDSLSLSNSNYWRWYVSAKDPSTLNTQSLGYDYSGTTTYLNVNGGIYCGVYTVRNISVNNNNLLYIKNSGNENVTDCYTISYQNGTLTINPLNFSDDSLFDCELSDSSYVYDGTAKTPTFTIKRKGTQNVINNIAGDSYYNFTYYYKNNKEAGTAKIVITGQNNCTGRAEIEFEITQADLSEAVITLEYNSITYDGSNKTPSVVSVYIDDVLYPRRQAGSTQHNFKITYENNQNAGTASVTIEGGDGYNLKNSKTVTFTITKRALSTFTLNQKETFHYGDNKEIGYYVEISNVESVRSGVVFIGNEDYTLFNTAIENSTSYTVKNSDVDVTNSLSTIYIGDYTLSVNVGFSSDFLKNYTVSYQTGTFTVSKRNLELYANNISINATETPSQSDYGYTAENLVNGDTVTGTASYVVYDNNGPITTAIKNLDYGTYYIYLSFENFDIVKNNQSVISNYNYVFKNGADGGKLIIGTYALRETYVSLNLYSYVYDRSAKIPVVTVVVNGYTLSLGEDYVVNYSDNLNVGTAHVTVTGSGNFSGTVVVDYEITKLNLNDNENISATLDPTYFTYNGRAQTPAVTVKIGNTTLVKGEYEDYGLSVANNQDAGTATVTITGTTNCSGTITRDFDIKSYDLENATVTINVADSTYNSADEVLTGTVTVKATLNALDGEKTLVEGTDYDVEYENNNTGKIGTAKVIVNGVGNFKGTNFATFETIAYWKDFVSETELVGSGTSLDPYIISTAQQLEKFAITVNGQSQQNRYAELSDNIDLSGRYFTPISNQSSKYFSGEFDGKNHTIIGLTINSTTNFAGLFGCTNNVEIKNLGFKDANVHSTVDNVGIIVGDAYNTKITNCYTSGKVQGRDYVGGVVGYFSNTEISNTYQRADVNGNVCVGGIAGGTNNDGIKITDSFAECDISANAYIGGLVGIINCNNLASENSVINISKSFYHGTIEATTSQTGGAGSVGGLIGYSYCSDNVEDSVDCKVSDCYLIATINAQNLASSSNSINAIAGYKKSENSPKIENCYNFVTYNFSDQTITSKEYLGEFSPDSWFYYSNLNSGLPTLKSIFIVGQAISNSASNILRALTNNGFVAA